MENEIFAGLKPNEVYEIVREAVIATNKKLPSFKHITGVEIRYEPFEKNTSQKIKRYKVQ